MRKEIPLLTAAACAIMLGGIVLQGQLGMLPSEDIQYGEPLNIWIMLDVVFLVTAVLFTWGTFQWWRRGGPLPDWIMNRSGET